MIIMSMIYQLGSLLSNTLSSTGTIDKAYSAINKIPYEVIKKLFDNFFWLIF